MNPYLPLNENIPDGEPHVFGHRIYIYGSHDETMGKSYCPLDYVLYSADISDLTHWDYHGIIYHKMQDPNNLDGSHHLYAPDIVMGNDGNYYLYYALDGVDAISVARANKPEGPFEYYGTVKYCVDREILPDYPSSFDPGVLNDNGHIYLAFGFSVDFRIESMNLTDQNTRGAYIVELEDDMLTMKSAPTFIVPGYQNGKGTSFEGHEFLEASSLRKFDNIYYFIYSSQKQHELCYATSSNPFGPYTYQGVLISNAYEGKLKNNWANNHGSIEKINNDYYIFYHRHTCGTQYSRQCCAEKINKECSHFKTASITCSGFDQQLEIGTYPAGYACYVYDNNQGDFIGFDSKPINKARIVVDKIENITNTTIVYRYFKEINSVTLDISSPSDGYLALIVNSSLVKITKIQSKMNFEVKARNAEITLKFTSSSPLILNSIQIN